MEPQQDTPRRRIPIEAIDRGDRGLATNRHLSIQTAPSKDWYDQELESYKFSISAEPGILEILSMDLEELRGAKVLEVGTGGGRALDEAVSHGVDYYGVDLAHITAKGFRHGLARTREALAIENLHRVIAKYPNRFETADAAQEIPFENDSFDVVLSCIALPVYARNPKEAITSILEMIRVSKRKVVFTAWPQSSIEGIRQLGVGKNSFNFELKSFLDGLAEAGVTFEFKVSDEETLESHKHTSVHLDVTDKDQQRLDILREDLLSRAESFKKR